MSRKPYPRTPLLYNSSRADRGKRRPRRAQETPAPPREEPRKTYTPVQPPVQDWE